MLRPADSVNAFILAGGASKRMGADKAFLRWQGETLIVRAIALLRSLGLEPRIVGTREDLQAYAPVLADRRSGRGPLSGIEAGLAASTTDHALFIPIDLPLLPSRFLDQMMSRTAMTGALVTVPRFQGREQPLCAVYHRQLLPAITRALDDGDYKVLRVLKQAALVAVEASTSIDLFDVETVLAAAGDYIGWPSPVVHAFINCNTPQDLQQAKQQVK